MAGPPAYRFLFAPVPGEPSFVVLVAAPKAEMERRSSRYIAEAVDRLHEWLGRHPGREGWDVRRTYRDFLRDAERTPELAEMNADGQPMVDIALMIVGARMDLGLTQRQFADNAGVSQAYISQLESGNANPSIRRVAELLRANGLRFEMRAVPLADTTAASPPRPVASKHRKIAEDRGSYDEAAGP